MKEGDINTSASHIYFPNPKEKEWKVVPLIAEDIEILKSFPLSSPSMLFFRHVKGVSGVAENDQFGMKYLYKYWKRACANLGVEDVDLYGGTKHSSVTALKKKYSPEEIKNKGTGHKTNKAFDRYLMIDHEDSRELYADAAPHKVATVLQPDFLHSKVVK